MGKQKKTRKFAQVKRLLTPRNPALKKNVDKADKERKAKELALKGRNVEQYPAALFFKHNEALGPPYRVLVDTNFINFSIKNKIEIVRGMMDCLLAKCIPCILESVIAELEKLGPK
jgi:U3 small nucleolar RNA-associated protein 24